MKTYHEAEIILREIKNAENILLSLHIDPDADSVGANLALKEALSQFDKKKVEIVSADPVPLHLAFLPGSDKVIIKDISEIDLSAIDVLITLDASELNRITEHEDKLERGNLRIIAIDHHATNAKFGNINLVDKIGSTSELLYNLFYQWEIKITPAMAQNLFTGLCGDTGTFRYPNGTTAESLRAGADLLDKGARLADTSFNLYQRIRVDSLRLWGKILERLKINSAGKKNFVWAVVDYDEIHSHGESISREGLVGMFFQNIEDTDFGLLLVEEEKGILKGSLRSRTDVDVSKLALLFGGGGHKAASGFRVKIQGSFEKTVNDILEKIEGYLEKQ